MKWSRFSYKIIIMHFCFQFLFRNTAILMLSPLSHLLFLDSNNQDLKSSSCETDVTVVLYIFLWILCLISYLIISLVYEWILWSWFVRFRQIPLHVHNGICPTVCPWFCSGIHIRWVPKCIVCIADSSWWGVAVPGIHEYWLVTSRMHTTLISFVLLNWILSPTLAISRISTLMSVGNSNWSHILCTVWSCSLSAALLDAFVNEDNFQYGSTCFRRQF